MPQKKNPQCQISKRWFTSYFSCLEKPVFQKLIEFVLILFAMTYNEIINLIEMSMAYFSDIHASKTNSNWIEWSTNTSRRNLNHLLPSHATFYKKNFQYSMKPSQRTKKQHTPISTNYSVKKNDNCRPGASLITRCPFRLKNIKIKPW